MRIDPIRTRDELVAAVKANDRPAWYIERLAKAYGVEYQATSARKPDFREQTPSDLPAGDEIANALENFASNENDLEQTETMVAAIVARNYHEGETADDLVKAFEDNAHGYLEHGRLSNDEYRTLVAAVTKTVRTPEGQKRFGDPINTPIKTNEKKPGDGGKSTEPVARIDINEVPIKRQPAPESAPRLESNAAQKESSEQFNNATDRPQKLSLDEVQKRLETADPLARSGFAPSESDTDDDRPSFLREQFNKALSL